MDSGDEILLEQFFPYSNMTIDERNFCINLLLHTKDVNNSETCIGKFECSIYDLLFMSFSKSKDGKSVSFNGATTSDFENRIIIGSIVRVGNKYFVKTNVDRCTDLLYDEDENIKTPDLSERELLNIKKEYTVTDIFSFKNNKVYRESKYEDLEDVFDDEVELMDDFELNEYLEGKIRRFKNELTLS